MAECLNYTLSELVDRFLLRSHISKKKYYAMYLTLAEEVWEDIFQNTLWVVKSVWMPTKAGKPYNYVSVPEDCLRLLSVGVDDKCGLIQPLFYNNQLNIISKPLTKKCGCGCSSCAGLCNDVNSMVATTRLVFTINGVNYYEKKWTEYCPNGDILEYTETPVKKYNSTTGDGGDYNDDFNDDYDIGSVPFSDFTIEYITAQKKICKLETMECGCPVENPANEQLLLDTCGCYINWGGRTKRKCCNQYFENVNNNHLGEIKLSECNTRIFYKPSLKWKTVAQKEIPDYLLVNYQSSGQSVGAETLVPKYARNVLFAGIDSGRKEFNSAYSNSEKMNAYYKYQHEKNMVINFLNPISLTFLSEVQDVVIKW